MTRILLMVQRLWQGGGTETHVLSLAKGLKERGHTVGILTTGGAWAPLGASMGIQMHIFGTEQFHSQTLQNIIRKHRYEVIHAHDTRSLTLISGLPSTSSRTSTTITPSCFVTVHGLYANRAVIRGARHRVRGVFAVSEAAKRFVVQQCGYPTDKVHTIPNGISTRTFHPAHQATLRAKYGIPNDALVIGYAGRFTFDKIAVGKRIARILGQYAKTVPNVYILIAGRNSKPVVRTMPNVIVAGHIPHMSRFYHSCDVVIGTGRVALESLASGKPTIAIGHSAYFGLVTQENFKKATDSNFGDHTHAQQTWHKNALIADLQYIVAHQDVVRRSTRLIAKTIQNQFSIQKMVNEILQHYHASIKT